MEASNNAYQEVGQALRRLHGSLQELGLSEALSSSASELPDTRERLAYVATLSEQAAHRALNAVEAAGPLQEELEARARELLAAMPEGDDVWRAQVREFLSATLPEAVQGTRTQLQEVMMAQDFQDLTGQVVRKVTRVAQELEDQLVHILMLTRPEGQGQARDGGLEGPQVSAGRRNDVVQNQQDVDDLLDSLGF